MRQRGDRHVDPESARTGARRAPQCDLSIVCPVCQIEMHPEHAHYKCAQCGYRDSCCF